MSSPRVWKLEDDGSGIYGCDGPRIREGRVIVIEKSAYDALIVENANLASKGWLDDSHRDAYEKLRESLPLLIAQRDELVKANAELVEALKFYIRDSENKIVAEVALAKHGGGK